MYKTCLFINLALCTLLFHPVSAQNRLRLSAGVELSSTGVGLEAATTLNPHFAVRGGISLFPIHYKVNPFEISMESSMETRMTTAMSNSATRDALQKAGLPTSLTDVNKNMDVTASLGLVNGKLLVDIYPSKHFAFHFTGGLYVGKERLINIDGKMKQMTRVLGVIEEKGTNLWSDIYADNENYQLTARDLTNINAAFAINKVKPYLGLGFGRAIPKRRVGTSFEIGAFYQGPPKTKSDNANVQKMIDYELADTADLLKYVSWWPVVSFKLNIALF